MAHLDDRLAEFFYGELSAPEMTDARRHVAECVACRERLEQFEKTHLTLKGSPDQDLPRSIIFASPEIRPRWSVFDWRTAVPVMFAAAALIIAILVAVKPTPGPASVSMPTPAPVVVQAQNVDYNRIINDVRQSERAWLSGELEKRDKEIRQLQGQLAYYESYQRTLRRETLENEASIQLLAQRTGSQD